MTKTRMLFRKASYLFWGNQKKWENIKCTVEDCFLRLVCLMFLFLINNYIKESTGRYSSRKTSLFLGRAVGYLSQVGLSKQSSKRTQNCGCQFQILLIKKNRQKQACLGWVWECPQGAEGCCFHGNATHFQQTGVSFRHRFLKRVKEV